MNFYNQFNIPHPLLARCRFLTFLNTLQSNYDYDLSAAVKDTGYVEYLSDPFHKLPLLYGVQHDGTYFYTDFASCSSLSITGPKGSGKTQLVQFFIYQLCHILHPAEYRLTVLYSSGIFNDFFPVKANSDSDYPFSVCDLDSRKLYFLQEFVNELNARKKMMKSYAEYQKEHLTESLPYFFMVFEDIDVFYYTLKRTDEKAAEQFLNIVEFILQEDTAKYGMHFIFTGVSTDWISLVPTAEFIFKDVLVKSTFYVPLQYSNFVESGTSVLSFEFSRGIEEFCPVHFRRSNYSLIKLFDFWKPFYSDLTEPVDRKELFNGMKQNLTLFEHLDTKVQVSGVFDTIKPWSVLTTSKAHSFFCDSNNQIPVILGVPVEQLCTCTLQDLNKIYGLDIARYGLLYLTGCNYRDVLASILYQLSIFNSPVDLEMYIFQSSFEHIVNFDKSFSSMPWVMPHISEAVNLGSEDSCQSLLVHLSYLLSEIESRQKLFGKIGNITDFNLESGNKVSSIFVFIDDLSEILDGYTETEQNEVRKLLGQLIRTGYFYGVHVILSESESDEQMTDFLKEFSSMPTTLQVRADVRTDSILNDITGLILQNGTETTELMSVVLPNSTYSVVNTMILDLAAQWVDFYPSDYAEEVFCAVV